LGSTVDSKSMKNPAPIIVIEDDLEDQEFLEETFSILKYPNQIIFFVNGNDAIEYIDQAVIKPMLVISDINMPVINGFEVRKKILNSETLRSLDIPFVFLTTGNNIQAVRDAYSLACGGFFGKGNSMEELRNTIKIIVEYWQISYTSGQIGAAQPEIYGRSFYI
jgi:CheY-like chemotaxis protein